MTIMMQSYAAGRWVDAGENAADIRSAVTGEIVARAGGATLDTQAMLDHARNVGGPALRAMTFHQRAAIIKALAQYLNERKEELYELSFMTGATRADSWIDLDGGIGTLFAFASKAKRELPDARIYIDGNVEQLSRNGTFLGRHVCTPMQGCSLQINAFNFPVWGMLEKFAPAFIAGMPSIAKPATTTGFVAEAAVRMMLDSGLLPEGSIQISTTGVGDMLHRLTAQDVVGFTGSADTALMLRSTPHLLKSATRFVAEQDSLNASLLGPDAAPGTPEFDLFIKEAAREITVKAGQKCTAIRRVMAPAEHVDAVVEALSARLSKTAIGDPRLDATRMGPVVSQGQRNDIAEKSAMIGSEATQIIGGIPTVEGADAQAGAFVAPTLFRCDDPDGAKAVHEVEAFGPVSTVMGYRDLAHGVELLNRGGGSLVASVITHDPKVAEEVVMGAGAWHGRIYVNNRDSMKEATGHGSPLPHMIHGGPGRAGGGEELGGIRGVMHFMQRTAVQGSPNILTGVTGEFTPGATMKKADRHVFRENFENLHIGMTVFTEEREITLADIEKFAFFTGDTFYAHMDEEAAAANPFFPGRVAHGYLLLSFAAGLFVDPAPGPVLANTGLNTLAFQAPVSPGDTIRVSLTVKGKKKRNEEYGEVRWHVVLTNQNDETVATYELLTMVEFAEK